jgi:hypothetical protein
MSCKKYLLWFVSIACCIHFWYLIFYVYVLSLLESQPSHSNNLIFPFYKLTIMTGNNVHFLILKNTKKFANLWWLNLGTESDVSAVWIFYCVRFRKILKNLGCSTLNCTTHFILRHGTGQQTANRLAGRVPR